MIVMFSEELPVAAVVAVALAYAWLAVASIVLALVDARTHRLPNRWVLPGYPVFGGLVVIACLLGAPWQNALRAALAGLLLFGFYLILRAAGGMGGGDVKLAGVLGLALGWVGWGAVLIGTVAGFVLGGLYGLMLVAGRRASASTSLPFGPWMLVGAWFGILAGPALATGIPSL